MMVKPAFALALYGEFLTRLSRPLGTPDILSGVYRPSLTAHLMVFQLEKVGKQCNFCRLVLHFRIPRPRKNGFDAPSYAMQQKSHHNIRML